MESRIQNRNIVARPVVFLIVGLLVAGALGCSEGPKVAEMGESVTVGGMTIQVQDYQIRRLEVVEDKRTHEYEKSALAIEVKLTNAGKDAIRYTPTHDSQQMTESNSPLLYSDPGKGKALPPKDKTPIPGVVLERGSLEGQVTTSTSVEPGKSITDLMLFQVPADEQADLIFSVPPSVHRGDKPVLFRIPYKKEKPKGPTWHKVGDGVDMEGVKFSVESVETTYVETEHTSDGKGFSTDPLLKITYKVENTSDEKISYNPGHHAVSGRRGASLLAGQEAIPRVRFSSNTKVVGQTNDSTPVEPGKSLTDFSLFERPGKEIKVLKFKYPASRFERAGLVRFNLPYEYESPEKPEPLKKKEEEDEEE